MKTRRNFYLNNKIAQLYIFFKFLGTNCQASKSATSFVSLDSKNQFCSKQKRDLKKSNALL